MEPKSTALVQKTGIYEADFFAKETAPGRSLLLQNFIPHLPEVGKIKIGRKGKWRTDKQGNKKFQQPERLKNFIVTSLERDENNNLVIDDEIHKLLGDKSKEHNGLKVLPIKLPYISLPLNFQSRFSCYDGKSLWCSGNGVKAQRSVKSGADPFATETVDCPCAKGLPGYTERDRCKFTCRLSCLISGIQQVGGVWIFRSTSYHTTKNIQSALIYINLLTQGVMNGIDLQLFLIPKTVPSADKNGKVANRSILTVGIRYPGEEQELIEYGETFRLERHEHFINAHRLENETQKLMTGTFEFGEIVEGDEENNEIVEEFFPEQAEAAGPPPDKPVEKKKKQGRPPKPALSSETTDVDEGTGEVVDVPPMKTEEAQVEDVPPVEEAPNTKIPPEHDTEADAQQKLPLNTEPKKEEPLVSKNDDIF